MTTINSVGVVGAGIMGQGIAQVFASAGFTTSLFDVNPDVIIRGISSIEGNLKTAVTKGKLTPTQKKEIEKRITPIHSLQTLKADLIIEAVIENLEIKRQLFRELEKINSVDTILLTNTSSLSVTEIGSVLQSQHRFGGLHFFNPAQQMKLVEVIAGTQTNPKLVTFLVELSKKLGKIPVAAKDSPGFIVNRVARHYYVESLRLLEEQISDERGIDLLMKSAGFKMGPFELMDLIGIDTNYSVTQSLHQAFYPNPKFMPSAMQKQKIDSGHLGRKTGKGFYDYEKK